MKCESCHEHEAHIRITAIINGIEKNFFLCGDCARKSMEEHGFNLPGFEEMMKRSFEMDQEEILKEMKEGLGDDRTEELFGNLAENLLDKLKYFNVRTKEETTPQASLKKAKAVDEQTRLTALLKRAIEIEDYKEAARLRDELEALTNH